MLWEVPLDILSKHRYKIGWLAKSVLFWRACTYTIGKAWEFPRSFVVIMLGDCCWGWRLSRARPYLRIWSERSLVASEIPQGEFPHRKRAVLWFLFAQLQSMGWNVAKFMANYQVRSNKHRSAIVPKLLFFIATVGMSVHWLWQGIWSSFKKVTQWFCSVNIHLFNLAFLFGDSSKTHPTNNEIGI